MTVLFLHQFEHCDCHSNDADANCGLGNGREFTRMQTRQWLPGLFALGDFFRIDRADVKINRWNRMVRQTVFGKIFAAHGWIDDIHVFVA